MVLYSSKLLAPEPVEQVQELTPPPDIEDNKPSTKRRKPTPKTQPPSNDTAPGGGEVEVEELKVKVEEGSKLKVKSEKQIAAIQRARVRTYRVLTR